MISFWAPVQIQSVLKSPVVMGLIISFQSVVGFTADLIFPKMFRNATARSLMFWGIMASGFTSFFLVNTIFWPFLAIFLITMALWGIYYELLAFAGYQFIGSSVPAPRRASAWALVGVFVNLAYFLAPLLAAALLLKGHLITETVIIIFLICALVILMLTQKQKETSEEIDLHEINPLAEFKHWISLGRHVWPAIIVTLLLGIIDSTFWTVGAVWTEKLSGVNFWGSLFLPVYQFPAIVVGFLVAKWGIYKGKKIVSEKMLIISGIFLLAMAVNGSIAWQLVMVFASSIALAVCYPLIQGVFTDISERMGQEKKEMIGLTNSITNISYIIGPILSGVVAAAVGERMTFSVIGAGTLVIATVLLFVTPKKLRLPQTEIKTWD